MFPSLCGSELVSARIQIRIRHFWSMWIKIRTGIHSESGSRIWLPKIVKKGWKHTILIFWPKNAIYLSLSFHTSKLQEKPPVQSWSWSSRPKSMWIHAGLDELLQINTKINLVYLSDSRQVVSCITTSLSSSVFIKTCAVSIFVWKQYNNFHTVLEEARRDNNIKWCTPSHSSNDFCLNFIKKRNKRNKSIIICTDPDPSIIKQNK